MGIERLTYADLAGRLGTSRDAARSLVRRRKLPRQTANDGTVRVTVDLAEIRYRPSRQRSLQGPCAIFNTLKAQVEQLGARGLRLETADADQADSSVASCVVSFPDVSLHQGARLAQLERENADLRRYVADLVLEIQGLKDLSR